MTDLRNKLVWVARYGVGFGALGWLAWQADWGVVSARLLEMHPAAVAAVVGISALGLFAQFTMYHVLLNRVRPTRFSAAANATLTVQFINHITPSQAVGRSLAPAVLRQCTDYSWGTVVAVATVHTMLFAMLYGLVASTGLVAFAPQFSTGLLAVVALSAGLYVAVGLLLLLAGTRLKQTTALAASARSRIPVERLPYAEGLLNRAAAALPDVSAGATKRIGSLCRDPLAVGGYAVAWSVALLVAPGIRVWLLLDAAGVQFTPAVLLPLALVTAYAVTLLPITPGGIGIAETSAALVLVTLGVPPTVAGPTVIFDRFLGVYLPAVIGWYPTMRLRLPWESTE